MLEINCEAEDNQVEAFKTLLTVPYIKTMTGIARNQAISSISKLFEIPKNAMTFFIDLALASDLDSRKTAMKGLLGNLQMNKT
jgi:hypothetical protein